MYSKGIYIIHFYHGNYVRIFYPGGMANSIINDPL